MHPLRGKCKEISEELCSKDASLRLVRGIYFDYIWGDQQHWWCEKIDGTIVDATKDQFPSKGDGVYTEFNGVCTCDNCGSRVLEEDAITHGRYALCSDACMLRFVGL
jgi:hypothetical protein